MRGRCVGTTGARLSTTEGGCTAEEGRTVQNNWHADALLIEGKGGCCKERRWRFCRAPAGDRMALENAGDTMQGSNDTAVYAKPERRAKVKLTLGPPEESDSPE